ncbi:MAG: ribonuclease III [Armatimonadetes bacterium]|jgi:ribonuclease-3|nr:ribonuclease III [Armatimonadota bacterium]
MDDLAHHLSEEWGVPLTDVDLLTVALTHRSYVRERADLNLESNERLEFFGDAVLGFVVAEHLYRTYPDYSEGELSRVKAVVVSEPLLYEAARAAGIGPHLLMSRAEEAAGGRDRPSILSDAFEAIVGALYLQCGMDHARQFILRFLSQRIDAIARHEHDQDFKTAFQELVQAEGKGTPTYRIVSQEGPDHLKVFTAEAKVGRKVYGRGTGRSKKEAEQSAAHDALEKQAAKKAR